MTPAFKPPQSNMQTGTRRQPFDKKIQEKSEGPQSYKTTEQNTGPIKYSIMELYWLFNTKMKDRPTEIEDNEADIVVISFNIAYGNLRIGLNKFNKDYKPSNVVYMSDMQKLAIGQVYPSTMFRLMNSEEKRVIAIEQLYYKTNEPWQQNRPIVSFSRENENIKMEIKDKQTGKVFWYEFSDWQKAAFEHACQFALTQGFTLTGMKKLAPDSNVKPE